MRCSETVAAMIDEKIKKTELFKAMQHCGRYEDDRDCINTILQMRADVRQGEDPDEILHQEGFEPDYIFDLI